MYLHLPTKGFGAIQPGQEGLASTAGTGPGKALFGHVNFAFLAFEAFQSMVLLRTASDQVSKEELDQDRS